MSDARSVRQPVRAAAAASLTRGRRHRPARESRGGGEGDDVDEVACRRRASSRRSGRSGALSYRFKCRSGSGRSVRADAAETVSRIGHPSRNPHRVNGGGCGTLLCGHGRICKIPLRVRLTKTATVARLSRRFACGCGYRHGRPGSCRAAATASARARCAWPRVIDCCAVMRSCATDHRSRASGRVISIPGSRRSSSSDSEIERV